MKKIWRTSNWRIVELSTALGVLGLAACDEGPSGERPLIFRMLAFVAYGADEAEAATFELLANSWIAVRDDKRSRAPLSKAAELFEDGNLFVRLGQVYMQDEDWGTASTLFEKAVA